MQTLRYADIKVMSFEPDPPYFLVDTDLRQTDDEINSEIEQRFLAWADLSDVLAPVYFDSESSAFVMYTEGDSPAERTAMVEMIDRFDEFRYRQEA